MDDVHEMFCLSKGSATESAGMRHVESSVYKIRVTGIFYVSRKIK